ncbi:MAG: hypothetical protein N2379_00995 [Verrucomicrobiae bacterium]|nr:hypothetical protein [Verrucomicrobiae bacterium]
MGRWSDIKQIHRLATGDGSGGLNQLVGLILAISLIMQLMEMAIGSKHLALDVQSQPVASVCHP